MAKSQVDWERIERDYRAGLLSLREIAAQHPDTNHVAITRRAKAEGWPRDLTAKIKAKAEQLVTKQAVTHGVTNDPVTERSIIEANATAIVMVKMNQRKDIAKARALAMKLLAELEAQTDRPDLLEELESAIKNDGDKGLMARLEALNRITSLQGRVKNMNDIANTLKTMITLEREAYGISEVQKLAVTDVQGNALPATNDPMEAARAYQKIMSGEA